MRGPHELPRELMPSFVPETTHRPVTLMASFVLET